MSPERRTRCPECPHCQAIMALETKEQLHEELVRIDGMLTKVKHLLRNSPNALEREGGADTLIRLIERMEES